MITHLKRGQCLVRQALSSFPDTMLVVVDYVPPHRGVPQPPDTHPYVPAQRLQDMPEVYAALRALVETHEHASFRGQKKKKQELPDNARKLLDLATLYPYEPVSRIWARLGSPSPSVQSAARKALEKRKYARFCETRQGKSNLMLVEITASGYEFLGKVSPGVPGAGGVEHRHYCEWIRRIGQKRGYRAETEQPVPNGTGRTDVLWWRDSECHAFEVVVDCSVNLCDHLRSCLVTSNAVNTVAVVAAQKSLLEKLRELVAADEALENVRTRIVFQLIEPYLKELWP